MVFSEREKTRGLFYQHGFTLNPPWISNYIHYKMWSEIAYPFLNFNSTTVEVKNGKAISSRTLPGVWLLIHAGIKVNPC